MSIETVTFKEKTASREEIYVHLCVCDGNYKPNLHERVDILDYSNKIFENSVTFEAWSNKSLVGLVAAYLNDVSGRTGYITNVSIMKKFMGKGIATALIAMCIEKSKKNNIKIMELEVFRGNIPAINLYRKFGFRTFQASDDSILMKLYLEREKNDE